MRQLKQIYPLLALVLITISPVTSVAEPMENSSDKEDSYFKERMNNCKSAWQKLDKEPNTVRSHCDACSIDNGRTTYEKGLFETKLSQCLSGGNGRGMYHCGNKALCHSHVVNIKDCSKSGTCPQTLAKLCSDTCTPPVGNNCIPEDKNDFEKARALCATKGASQYELLAESEVERILQKRADEMYPDGSSTSRPPQSELAKTSIFSPSSQGSDTVNGASTTTDDTDIKSNVTPSGYSTNTNNTSDLTNSILENSSAPAPVVSANSGSLNSVSTPLTSTSHTSTRVSLPSEEIRRPVVFKEDDPMSGVAKPVDWGESRKAKTFDARSLPHNSEPRNSARSAKVVADNTIKDEKRRTPATIESSSFQSGFHKRATANKKIYSGIKSIHTTSKIAASGKGSMDLSKLFKNRLKMRRGPAQHDFNWNELRGQIGSGPHPIFLGVDQYFHKVRLDYNGEMAN